MADPPHRGFPMILTNAAYVFRGTRGPVQLELRKGNGGPVRGTDGPVQGNRGPCNRNQVPRVHTKGVMQQHAS